MVSYLSQAPPTTFLLFLDSTYLAFSFRTRGGFVAIGFYHGCAWCLATRCLREWLGLLKAVPQITDHPGYTLHNMPKHARLLAKAIHTSGGKHPIVPVSGASFQPQSYLGRREHLYNFVDATRRTFQSQRYCFLGSVDDWIEIGNPGKLSTLVNRQRSRMPRYAH